jgi:hypothetical protein
MPDAPKGDGEMAPSLIADRKADCNENLPFYKITSRRQNKGISLLG